MTKQSKRRAKKLKIRHRAFLYRRVKELADDYIVTNEFDKNAPVLPPESFPIHFMTYSGENTGIVRFNVGWSLMSVGAHRRLATNRFDEAAKHLICMLQCREFYGDVHVNFW